jgi:glycosyltransferase EpsF
MMRVLHVVGGLNVGGTETWLTQGLATIDHDRYQFDFLVFGDQPQFYRAAVESFGSRVLHSPPPRRWLSFSLALLRILRANHYQAVHAHTHCSSGLVLALAAWAGVQRRIFHSHTAQDDSRCGWLRSLYFKFSRRLIQRYASRGVAVSREAARPLFPHDWCDHPERWTIAPVGIDLSAFDQKCNREVVRRELDLPADSPVIVHIGRFVPVKNHGFLISIAHAMRQIDPSVVFLLVGDGPGRGEITRAVEECGIQSNVRFAGIRNDVPRILKACDAFVLPSLYEGFPMSYLEAQAAGLGCVISSAIASASDLAVERTWRLSTNQPARDWAAALRKALRLEPISEVPLQLREVSIERSIKRLMECYR